MPATTLQNKAATSKSLTQPLLAELFAPETHHRRGRAFPQAETVEEAATSISQNV